MDLSSGSTKGRRPFRLCPRVGPQQRVTGRCDGDGGGTAAKLCEDELFRSAETLPSRGRSWYQSLGTIANATVIVDVGRHIPDVALGVIGVETDDVVL